MEKIYYFYLDGEHKPIPCCKADWIEKMTGNWQLARDVVDKKKVLTRFVSRHMGGKLNALFKTTVYNNINSAIYLTTYDDYDSAIEGHKRICEEKPWLLRK